MVLSKFPNPSRLIARNISYLMKEFSSRKVSWNKNERATVTVASGK